ncbi:MAG: alpha/beta fold hydrolase [Arenibacterium sp.]
MLHHVIRGDGKTILVLHGATLDHRQMMESLEPIFHELDGWKRIYVDLPGHGHSPAQDDIASQDDMLEAVMDFAGEMISGKRFAVVGESRGSYLAHGMVHANPDPITGAALIVPGGSPTADPQRLPSHHILEPDPSLQSMMSEEEKLRFESFYVVQRRDALEKARRSKDPARALWDQEQAARVNSAFDFTFHTNGETTLFDGPSVIVAGRQDCMSGYLDAIDLLPQFTRATLAVLDTAGHALAWERPEIFNALIRDWLDRVKDHF